MKNAIVIVALLTSIAFGHPGRLDSNGGHKVKGGGYHTHREKSEEPAKK